MRHPTSFPEGTAERLKILLKQAKSKTEFQRIQAVYLRVATPMTPEEIAVALAWHPGTVRNIHSAFLRSGESAFQVSSRGGRHRENLSLAEENELLEQFLKIASDGGVVVVSSIKAAYEEKLWLFFYSDFRIKRPKCLICGIRSLRKRKNFKNAVPQTIDYFIDAMRSISYT
jgi:hypothetical protein